MDDSESKLLNSLREIAGSVSGMVAEHEAKIEKVTELVKAVRAIVPYRSSAFHVSAACSRDEIVHVLGGEPSWKALARDRVLDAVELWLTANGLGDLSAYRTMPTTFGQPAK